MQQLLFVRLHHYLVQHHPDLILSLQEENRVSAYLQAKVKSIGSAIKEMQENETPAWLLEEQCMHLLIEDLNPSRYDYLLTILGEEFEPVCEEWRQHGILMYEVVNLIYHCQPVFNTLHFCTDNEENRKIRYAITGAISEYLDQNQYANGL